MTRMRGSAWLAARPGFALAALRSLCRAGIEAEIAAVRPGRSGGDRRPRARARRSTPTVGGARDRGGAGGQRRRSCPELPRSCARPRRRSMPPQRRRGSRRRSSAAIRGPRAGESFARGLITGEPDDLVGLAGTALGDLFVFGDIRDAVREGSRYVSGEPADELVLGLCRASASRSPPAPMRRSARRRRRGSGSRRSRRRARPAGSSAQMADWIGRSLREVVDWSALQARRRRQLDRARGRGARRARGGQGREGRWAVRLVGDVGRVQAQGRHPGRARRAQARRKARATWRGSPRSPRRRAARPARSSRARPRRDPAVGRLVQSRAVDARGAPDAVRASSPRPSAAAERMTQRYLARKKARRRDRALAKQALAIVPVRGLNLPRPWSSICPACRVSPTGPSRSPISTRARASRSCWCTALPPPRR